MMLRWIWLKDLCTARIMHKEKGKKDIKSSTSALFEYFLWTERDDAKTSLGKEKKL